MAPREKAPAPTVTIKKRAPRKTAATGSESAPSYSGFDPDRRMALIAEAAYFRAEKRGFSAGGETEDWLAAEAEVDANLLRATKTAPRV